MNRESRAGHEHLSLRRRGQWDPDEKGGARIGAEFAGWCDAIAGANAGRTVQLARAEGSTIACKSAERDSELARCLPSDRDIGRGDAFGRRPCDGSSVEYLGFRDSRRRRGSRLPASFVGGPTRRLYLEGSHRYKSFCTRKARAARSNAGCQSRILKSVGSAGIVFTAVRIPGEPFQRAGTRRVVRGILPRDLGGASRISQAKDSPGN